MRTEKRSFFESTLAYYRRLDASVRFLCVAVCFVLIACTLFSRYMSNIHKVDLVQEVRLLHVPYTPDELALTCRPLLVTEIGETSAAPFYNVRRCNEISLTPEGISTSIDLTYGNWKTALVKKGSVIQVFPGSRDGSRIVYEVVGIYKDGP